MMVGHLRCQLNIPKGHVCLENPEDTHGSRNILSLKTMIRNDPYL
jgi:hypothetical protein